MYLQLLHTNNVYGCYANYLVATFLEFIELSLKNKMVLELSVNSLNVQKNINDPGIIF